MSKFGDVFVKKKLNIKQVNVLINDSNFGKIVKKLNGDKNV